MSVNFIKAMQAEENKTYTENGATGYKSTGSALLDLFGVIGALRTRDEAEIERLFMNAFAEDKLLATKMSFYARNVRGGLGERDTVRIIWRYLAYTNPQIMKKNLHLIPLFGRWDDLYIFIGTPLEKAAWQMIRKQFFKDYQTVLAYQQGGKLKSISLLAKWLKSVNSSIPQTRKLALKTAKNLKLTETAYRKALSMMRAYLDIVERKMTANQWTEIDYAKVPSRAMTIYRNAFRRHDEKGFQAYLDAIAKGKAKINASTLYPYNLIEAYDLDVRSKVNKYYLFTRKPYDAVIEEQWKALPNYVEGENNVLVMADTSGSMYGRPLATAVGLAIYFAERNKGPFKDVFMTFSSKPSFVTLKGDSLYDKIKCIPYIIENTNLQAAFKLILDVAIKNNLSAEDMPKSLIVISDMEFDEAQGYDDKWLFYDKMKAMYEEHGYQIPNVIFWNVDSRNDVFHVVSQYKGVQLASGQSVSVFKSVLANIGKTPYEAMLEVLNDPIYDVVTV